MTRVLSALVLLPAVLAVVWFLPPAGTLVLAILAAVIGVTEFAAMAAALGASIPTTLVALLTAALCGVVGLGLDGSALVLLAALVIVGTWLVSSHGPGPAVLGAAGAALFAVVYIGLPLGAIAGIRAVAGREAVVLLMITIVVSDSAQYYTGRAFGRSPLAPTISPKKTREGAVGGVLFGAAAMTAGGRIVFPDAGWIVLAVTALAVVALGIVGDLFESLLKRSAGVKDSSGLIPGHGGILDRIDSWLFAGPAFYVFVRYLQ